MKVRLTAASVLLCVVCFFSAAADVSVVESPVPKNSFARVSVKLEKGQTILWDVYPEPVTTEEFTRDDQACLNFSGLEGASYKVKATILTIKDGGIVAVRTTKAIPFAGEIVPPPDVDPEPLPVDPVTGTKVGASLVPGFKAAWLKDASAERPLVSNLAQFYTKWANADLSKYATWGELVAAQRADAPNYGFPGKLLNTQTAVFNYLTTYLPGKAEGWESKVLTDSARKSAKVAFSNVGVALGRVK